MADWYDEDVIADASTPAENTATTDAPAEPPVDPAPTEDAPVEQEQSAQGDTPPPEDAPATTTTTTPHADSDASVAVQESAPDKQKHPMIPKSRLDEEIEKRRRLEEEHKLMQQFVQTAMQQQIATAKPQTNQQQQSEQAQPTVAEVLADLHRKEYAALLEGDTDTAMAMRQQADNLVMYQAQQTAMQATQSHLHSSQEDIMFNESLARATREYPIFDQNSPLYNAQFSNMAVTLGESLIARGVPKSQIIDKVLEHLSPVLSVMMPQQQVQQQAPARSLATNVAAAAAQPPATHRGGSAGSNTPRIDINSMTIEDFERLSPAEIEKLYVR